MVAGRRKQQKQQKQQKKKQQPRSVDFTAVDDAVTLDHDDAFENRLTWSAKKNKVGPGRTPEQVDAIRERLGLTPSPLKKRKKRKIDEGEGYERQITPDAVVVDNRVDDSPSSLRLAMRKSGIENVLNWAVNKMGA